MHNAQFQSRKLNIAKNYGTWYLPDKIKNSLRLSKGAIDVGNFGLY